MRLAVGLGVAACVFLVVAGILWIMWDREPAPASLPVATTAVIPAAPVPTAPALETVPIHLFEASTTRVLVEMVVGDWARMEFAFEPVLHQVMRRSDGGVSGASFQPLEAHNVAEMQICTSLDRPCSLEVDWQPFETRHALEMPVDWVGAREFWLTASFRDVSGQTIPSLGSGQGEADAVSQSSYTIVGLVADVAPVEALPAQVQTAVVATRAAYPVQGSVEIWGGSCCVGGTAGDTIQLKVAFVAESPAGEVRGMRVRTGGACYSEEQMVEAGWQPFAREHTYPFQVAINWVGFYASAQYREEAGNLSAVAVVTIYPWRATLHLRRPSSVGRRS